MKKTVKFQFPINNDKDLFVDLQKYFIEQWRCSWPQDRPLSIKQYDVCNCSNLFVDIKNGYFTFGKPGKSDVNYMVINGYDFLANKNQYINKLKFILSL